MPMCISFGDAARRRFVTAIYLSISALQLSPRAAIALCTCGFLQPDRLGNGVVFGGCELGRVDLTLGETGAFAQQLGRTEQTADMFGAKRRFSRERTGRRLRADIHEAPPISGILTPSAFAVAANSSHSFGGIGMPVLRRAVSVRPPRSPGNKISSMPARRGSALTIAASVSASV